MSAGLLPDPDYAHHRAAVSRERHEDLMRALWDIGTSPFKARFLAGGPEIELRTSSTTAHETINPTHE